MAEVPVANGLRNASDSGGRLSIAIVMPCRNAAPYIREALETVLRQTRRPAEVVVVDDGSVDESREIAAQHPVRLLLSPRLGAPAARNEGLALTSSEFVMFLDADDVLEPTALEDLSTALVADPEAGLALVGWRCLLPRSWGWVISPPPRGLRPASGDPLRDWLHGWFTPPCAILWRRSTLRVVGPWDETLLKNQDGDLVMRALAAGVRVARARGTGAMYRRHPAGHEGISSSVSAEAVRSQMRVLEKLEQTLRQTGAWPHYRRDVGQAYHVLAKHAAGPQPGLSAECESRARRLAGIWRVADGSLAHQMATLLLGLARKERLARCLRSAMAGE